MVQKLCTGPRVNGQDCNSRGDAPKSMIDSQDGKNGKISTRSGQISCRPENLGIDI